MALTASACLTVAALVLAADALGGGGPVKPAPLWASPFLVEAFADKYPVVRFFAAQGLRAPGAPWPVTEQLDYLNPRRLNERAELSKQTLPPTPNHTSRRRGLTRAGDGGSPMTHRKLSVLMLVIVLGASSTSACAAQRRRRQSTKQPTTNIPAQPTQSPARNGGDAVPTDNTLTELAAGNYGDITAPFIFVARDAQTYAALRKMLTGLPDQNANFFQANVVIAAFLGQRRTGGYRVEIKQTGRQSVSVTEQAPAKGAMVTMALTAPFRVVALPLDVDQSLDLTLDTTWRARLRPYQLTGGELLVYGGFAGRQHSAKLTGQLSVMRAGELATFVFNVQSTGEGRAGRLVDTATGRVAADGQVSLSRLDSFGLSGATEAPLRARGEFVNGEQDLTLSFETVQLTNVADNFAARGQLNAHATAPAPSAVNKVMNDEPM